MAAGPTDLRLLCDSMLGSLARWLRLLGIDTLSVDEELGAGATDPAIADLAARQGAVLLTRDKALAASVGPRGLLIGSVVVQEQLAQVVAALRLPTTGALSRCSHCNGLLQPAVPPPPHEAERAGLPPQVARGAAPLWRCQRCGHRYWHGSHTDAILAAVRSLGDGPDAAVPR